MNFWNLDIFPVAFILFYQNQSRKSAFSAYIADQNGSAALVKGTVDVISSEPPFVK